jgi:enediyne biosynthesis protein E4
MLMKKGTFIFLIVLFSNCTKPSGNGQTDTLFCLLDPRATGIEFVNELEYTEELNTYTSRNFYNGGGVGLGDFNNDGLLDVFLCGNLVSNELYLNKGALKFENITASAGLVSKGVWTTGVSIADINGDSYLDIYLCKSGPPGGARRHNELFINNGDLTFSEKANEYGLAFEGLATHAAFFDYDKDGDLDCYLLNNSFRPVGGFDLRENQRNTPDPNGGNKLLRNDNGKYVDRTQEAGIYSSVIGFGLGVTIGDVNLDGWQDIFVSNDFFEKDYLYINNKNGSFTESLEDFMREISLGSMGADMADINNDALPEIYVTEMLPEHDDRLKTTSQFESYDRRMLSVKSGYYNQFSRNVLQLNNGNGTFSEISRLAGVHATDWSWGALIFDMNNDGWKDIFVANGIYKDLLDQDYVNFIANPEFIRQSIAKGGNVITRLIDSIPSNKIQNYAFENQKNLNFVNKATAWGFEAPTHSNGSAYGDLDNDGDLDLVLNNVNEPSGVYENRAKQLFPNEHSISVVLKGSGKNLFGLGSKVTIKCGKDIYFQELSPMRGFMSTVDSKLLFGTGSHTMIDTVTVQWPDGRISELTQLKADQIITIEQSSSKEPHVKPPAMDDPILKNAGRLPGVDFIHHENDYVDFDRDRLLFNMASNEGPCACVGDVNRDGLDDFYLGMAKGFAGRLFVQTRNGGFTKVSQETFDKDKDSEDTDCAFFDANGDGWTDLYVTSGSNEFSSSSYSLVDRLYLNNNGRQFERSKQTLPTSRRFESTSSVAPNDFDKDGDIDLFVGVRLIPFQYGLPGNGYILENDGKGNFSDQTSKISTQLQNLGLITDARWADINQDTFADLIVCGEWMGIKIFIQEYGKFIDRSSEYGLDKSNGWYNAIEIGDVNKDGFPDIVAGNHGLNSRFKATEEEPVSMYVNDFDKNGTLEHIITRYDQGVEYPFVLRSDLVTQIPSLKKKYLYFDQYKGKTINDIFSVDQLKNTLLLRAFSFETALWMNQAGKKMNKVELPLQTQLAAVYGILIDDFDKDGMNDILLGGNLCRAKPETGIYDASYGTYLKGDGKGGFTWIRSSESGVSVKGEIRSIRKVRNKGRNLVLIARNNEEVVFFSY